MKKKIKILILGGRGQLGSALSSELKKNKKLIIYRDFFYKISLNNIKKDKIKIFKINPNIIINCSAYTNVDKAENEKKLCKWLNDISIKYLLKICLDCKSILIHFSTDYVFDGSRKFFCENDNPNPLNYYGKTKRNGEIKIIKSKINFFIFRISWLLSNNKKSFVSKILKKIYLGKKFYVINDNYGNPTTTLFIAKFIDQNIDNFFTKPNGIYNLVNTGVTSWYSLAKKIIFFKKIKEQLIKKISYKNFKSNAKRPIYSILSMKKTRKNFIVKKNHWHYELKKLLK